MSEKLYDLAAKAHEQGDNESAIRYCLRLLEKTPLNVEVLIFLGILYGQEKQWANAISSYEKAIAIDANHENSFFNLAMAQINEEQIESAIENLKNTLNLNPNHVKAHRQLAQLLQQGEELEQAISHYKTSLKIDPNHLETHVNLGAALQNTGDTLDAIQHFNKALLIDPENFEAHYNLGAIYLNAGNLDQALIHYISLLDKHKSPDVYYNIGVVYMYQDRLSEAIGFLKQATEYDKNYSNAYVNLGVCYLKIDDLPKATEHFEIAHQLRPDNQEVTYILDALQQKEVHNAAPPEFIRNLFDQYAPIFEKHLTELLDYHSPEKLHDAVLKILPSNEKNYVILDLGSGTGLCGALFKHLSKKLIAVDISPNMNVESKAKNIYDEIYTANLLDALTTLKNNDIIIAADVFTYSGDLDHIFSLVHQALNKNGIFTFTVEKQDDSLTSDFHLLQTARFAHSINYIHRLATKHGFTINVEEEIILRTQKKIPLAGLLFVLRKSLRSS